tara:strand:+ start:210 stop:434 length:225 start_codon:yes stop_codon:yes gene_type:complete
MIITDPKENEIIVNLLRVLAYDCNLYWQNEDDIDEDKKEYDNYLKLKEKLSYFMTEKEINEIDLMSILYKFKQI